jgi:hypothetical protein
MFGRKKKQETVPSVPVYPLTYEQIRVIKHAAINRVMQQVHELPPYTVPGHGVLKIGTKCMLDIFGLKGYYDPWAGGGPMFLDCVDKREHFIEPWVTVQSVDVNVSHSIDFTERCADKMDLYGHIELLRHSTPLDLLDHTHTDQYKDKYRRYINIHFESSYSFKPQWGLPISSFLIPGTNDELIDMTIRTIELNLKKKLIESEIQELQQKREELSYST